MFHQEHLISPSRYYILLGQQKLLLEHAYTDGKDILKDCTEIDNKIETFESMLFKVWMQDNKDAGNLNIISENLSKEKIKITKKDLTIDYKLENGFTAVNKKIDNVYNFIRS